MYTYFNSLKDYGKQLYSNLSNWYGSYTNLHPAAKAYASKAMTELYSDLGHANKTLISVAQQGALESAARVLTDKDQRNAVKSAALLPAKAIHAANNFIYLAGVQDGKLQSKTLEDSFVLLSKPSI